MQWSDSTRQLVSDLHDDDECDAVGGISENVEAFWAAFTNEEWIDRRTEAWPRLSLIQGRKEG